LYKPIIKPDLLFNLDSIHHYTGTSMKIPVRLLYALACLTSLVSGCSSGTPSSSSSGTPPPTSPDITPAITSVNPAKLGAGAPGITLTVTGSGFLSSTTIEVAGVVESTAFISSTQISASVPASQLASGAVLNVIANNGSASSASGAAVNLEVDNPVPTITQFAPSTFASGSVGGTISVTGTGFVPTTVVQVNGIVRPTVFVSATQVNVAVTSADVALAGGLSLMAVNPSPAGGTSATASVPVNNPVPGAIILMPSSLPSGVSTATAVVVTGSNFLPSSTVQVGNSTRATTYVSPTELSFQLTVADQATAGRFAVSVVTPSPGGGTSPVSYITLVVSTQTPVLAQVSPNQFIAGSAQTTVAATGSNITANTVILWNGAPIATAYITNPSYGSYLVGTVSASLLASAGTASITLSSPDAAVPISNPLPVTLTIRRPRP
jgi:trimeric autotransporter adhesin